MWLTTKIVMLNSLSLESDYFGLKKHQILNGCNAVSLKMATFGDPADGENHVYAECVNIFSQSLDIGQLSFPSL